MKPITENITDRLSMADRLHTLARAIEADNDGSLIREPYRLAAEALHDMADIMVERADFTGTMVTMDQLMDEFIKRGVGDIVAHMAAVGLRRVQ